MITCRTFYGKDKQVKVKDLAFRPSAYGFIVHQDKLLIMDVSGPDKFSLPGGGIEKGETSTEALVRETKEETGLTILVDELVCVTEDFFYYDPWNEAWQGLLLFYNCHITSGRTEQLLHTNTGEGHDEKPVWADIQQLNPKDFIPPVATAFKKWRSTR